MVKLSNISVFDYDRIKICDLYDSQNDLLGSAYNIEFVKNYNGVHTLSFSMPYKIENEVNFRWQYMQSDYLIRLYYNGKNEWFVASKPQKTKDKNGVIGTVMCNGLPMILKTKNIYGEFDDENGIGTIRELMPKVLAGSGWSLGHCDIVYEKDGTTEKVRSLKSSEKQGALDLINTLCNLFRCRPEFDTENMTVNIYANTNRDQFFEGEIGRNLNMLSVSENAENIVTRLYVEGEYGEYGYVGIDDVNPTGLTYLMDFDYYRKIGVFKPRHETALQNYLTDIQDVNSRIKNIGQLINQQSNAINQQIGQCDLVLYYVSSGFNIPAHIYGSPAEEKQSIVPGDKVVVLNNNGTFRYEYVETTASALIRSGDYGIAKFITPSAGMIGSQEVQIEAKEKQIATLQRKIDSTTKADKIAEYTQEIAELNSQIDTIYNTLGTGLYARMHQVMNQDGMIKVLDDYLATLAVLRIEQNDVEATFIVAMGNMLRDGYWQNNNYAIGQEQALYDDAQEMSDQLSKPVYSYSLDYIRSKPVFESIDPVLTEYNDIPIDEIHINAIFRINDDDLNVHENMFIESVKIGIDKDDYGTISVSNNDLSINSNDLSSLLSRMSQLADLIDQKNQVYERAKAFSANGTLYAERLNGQIDVLKNQLLSTVSNWHTDEQGNILFESADGGSAMMLCGAGFMIASSKDEDGNWNWRTFGTGQGFTADEIIAGFISAERIEAGSIATSKLMPDVGNTLVISGNPAIINVEKQLAPEFDPTVSYSKGQMVVYNGEFYVFSQNHPAGAWNENHVVSSNLGAQIELLPDQIIEYVGEQGYSKTYIQLTDPALDVDKHVTTGDYWIKKSNAKLTWGDLRNKTWNDYLTYKWADIYLGISEIYCRNASGQWIQVYNTDIISTAYTQIRQTQFEITQEAYRANAAEGELQSKITQNAYSILQEVSRATAAENSKIAKTSIYQTADAIVSAANTYTNGQLVNYSTITQTSNAISAYVNNNAYKLVSGIEIKAAGIELTGAKYIKVNSGGSIDIRSGASFSVQSGNFSIDTNGNVSITGAITATSGSFTGTVNATSGSFTGTVTATSGSFTGTVNATSGSFTGTVNATSGSFTGTVTSTNGSIGSWTIANSWLYTGSGSTCVTLVGSSQGSTPTSEWNLVKDYALYAGASWPANAPFSVKKDGTVFLNSLMIWNQSTGQYESVNFSRDFSNAVSYSSGSWSGNTFTATLSIFGRNTGKQISLNASVVSRLARATTQSSANWSDARGTVWLWLYVNGEQSSEISVDTEVDAHLAYESGVNYANNQYTYLGRRELGYMDHGDFVSVGTHTWYYK